MRPTIMVPNNDMNVRPTDEQEKKYVLLATSVVSCQLNQLILENSEIACHSGRSGAGRRSM